ncbi:MAG: zinc ribbon domain-containing protein, partial [Chloroflexota bacterium]
TLDSPEFQFEFYDPVILEKQGDDRQLDYDVKLPYSTIDFKIEIQEPTGATDFEMLPVPVTVVTGGDQLTYHIFEERNVGLGDVVSVSSSYQKTGNSLTAGGVLALSSETNTTSITPQGSAFYQSVSVWMFGLGGVLLLSSVALWVFSSRGRLFATSDKSVASQACPNCGIASRQDAIFCHRCGVSLPR